MWEHGLAILYALFIWWFSTGLILYLDGLPRRTFSWSMIVMTVIALAALYGLWFTGSDTSLTGAYLSFTCGLLIWAWHELSFLTGCVTGPRRTPCPEVSGFWTRFRYASETVIHHELAIAATAALMAALTWGAANQIGLWTFVILWLMRLSAKLNIFLGVANLAEEFLPPHLRYLESYFRRRPLNLLFPVSVTVSTIATVLILPARSSWARFWRWQCWNTGSWCCRSRQRRSGSGRWTHSGSVGGSRRPGCPESSTEPSFFKLYRRVYPAPQRRPTTIMGQPVFPGAIKALCYACRHGMCARKNHKCFLGVGLRRARWTEVEEKDGL